MPINVYSPRPMRPPKQPLEDIDPECPPPRKQCRLSLTPSPTPSIQDQLLREPLPSLKPQGTLKRALEGLDSGYARAGKHRRLRAPASLTVSVHDWLSKVSRPSSAPPILNGRRNIEAVAERIERAASLSPCDQSKLPIGMSQQPQDNLRPASVTSSQTSRPGTSSALYRSVLYNNNVIIDPRGRRLPKELQEFRDKTVLKRRSSPQLDYDEVVEVMETPEELADSTECPTIKLLRTSMFPLKYRGGLGEGGNTQWPVDALPNNPLYQHSLAAPKPDVHIGYATSQRSQWTTQEAKVIDHRKAQPYAQPTRDNSWPFFMIEMKSEAAGGTHWHAENQAAGSGSYSVNSLGWLFAQSSQVHSLADKVAFTVTGTHRDVLFYMHWQSEEDRCFYMSYLKRYSFMEPQDIRDCNKTVKNIIDHALGARKSKIRGALQALFPFPENWKEVRKADSISDTPPTSFTTESTRSGKRRRRSQDI